MVGIPPDNASGKIVKSITYTIVLKIAFQSLFLVIEYKKRRVYFQRNRNSQHKITNLSFLCIITFIIKAKIHCTNHSPYNNISPFDSPYNTCRKQRQHNKNIFCKLLAFNFSAHNFVI